MEKVKQLNLFETEGVRSLLDQLLSDSQLYTQSKDYKKLLAFVVRLRNFAPFNAMLLQVQKPGLSYAASARDWLYRFGRRPKEGARPLLILVPFGPVGLVYDVMDTVGEPLPKDVSHFFACGSIDEKHLVSFIPLLKKKGIDWHWVDAGDNRAGSIRVIKRATNKDENTKYRMNINSNHPTPVKFTTLTHELGHLFLGHLGSDKALKIRDRLWISHSKREFEAESVAYLVCERNGVKPKSETYLSDFVNQDTTMEDIDVYQIMRAAGQIESLLDLNFNTKHNRSKL